MAMRMEVQEFHTPAQLIPVETDTPVPGEGEVLIRVMAAGVNPFDWKYLEGRTQRGAPTAFPIVPGNEAAGIIDAVGPGVEAVGIGDEVMWQGFLGAYATHLIAKVGAVRVKPAQLSFAQAASLPVAGGTAWAALDQAGVSGSDTVLIHGAAGGLGGLAIQIARAHGAIVIGTASAANQDYVRARGAIPVEYGDGLIERVRALGAVTAVVDFVGAPSTVAATVALLSDLSRAVSTAPSEESVAAGIATVARDPRSLGEVITLADRGILTVDVSRTFALRDAALALDESKNGHARGKIALLT